jgi:hypothetical protein
MLLLLVYQISTAKNRYEWVKDANQTANDAFFVDEPFFLIKRKAGWHRASPAFWYRAAMFYFRPLPIR